MAVDMGSAVGYLMLDTSNFTKGFGTAQTQLKGFLNNSNSLNTRINALGSAFKSVGSTLTKSLTLPLVGAGTAVAKAAIDFESAFTGVRKTVDATEEEYAQLSQNITEMSNRMPQSAEEIAGVMEVAGQLGVRGVESLTSFTETMIMLGDATNLSSEEAATSIARVMNIMGTADEDVGRFGSTVVALGNNFATTESEIVEMTNRLAAGGKLAGLTEAELMALATAMSSVGIQAEAGGTAMTQTFNAIETAVAKGGETLNQFASVANMSAQDFATMWKTKPIEAIQAFISGVGQLDEKGKSAVLVLEDLGLSGIRQSDMIKSLGLASDLLGDSINLANQAWEENTALTTEAQTRYGTLQSKLQILGNNVKNLGRSFGELLVPAIDKMIGGIQKLIQWISGLDDTQKQTVVRIAAIAAAIGPVLLIVSKLVTSVSSIGKAFTALASPVGIVVALIAVLVAAFVHLWQTSEEFRSTMTSIWEGLKDKFSEFGATMTEKLNSLGFDFENFGEAIRAAFDFLTDTLVPVFETAFSLIADIVSTGLDFIVTTFDLFKALFTGDWEGAWEALKEQTAILWEGIKQLFNDIIDGIKAIVDKWLDKFKSDWKQSWDDAVETVRSIGNALFEAGKSIFSSLWEGLKSVWSGIASWVEDKVGWIIGRLTGAKNSVSSEAGKVSGSFATGADYIIGDQLVKVHDGEAILTRQENKERKQGVASGSAVTVPVVFNVAQNIDGKTVATNQYKWNLVVDNYHGPSALKA